MKIGIIGSGISGLSLCYFLNKYNYDSPIAELFQQRRANPVQPQNIRLFTEMMANMNKGGIMGLRR